jgi:hypothetical protein
MDADFALTLFAVLFVTVIPLLAFLEWIGVL